MERLPSNYEFLARGIEHQYDIGEPKETLKAYQRLRKAEYRDEEICEMCVWVLAAEYFISYVLETPFNIKRYAKGLSRLPKLPWEDDGRVYPPSVTREIVREVILENPKLILTTPEEIRERYRYLRSRLTTLHDHLLIQAGTSAFIKSAQELEIDLKGTVVLDSEMILDVLKNHCIYGHPERRRKLVKAYQKNHMQSIDSDDAELLDAVINARYVLFLVQETIPNLVIEGVDLLTNDEIQIIDLNLGTTAVPNILLATFTVTVDNITMTSGAPLPVLDRAVLDEIVSLIQQDVTTDQNKLATQITRLVLKHTITKHLEMNNVSTY
jgi:hypothetical protein